MECVCGYIGEPGARYCARCGRPLAAFGRHDPQAARRAEIDRFADRIGRSVARHNADYWEREFADLMKPTPWPELWRISKGPLAVGGCFLVFLALFLVVVFAVSR